MYSRIVGLISAAVIAASLSSASVLALDDGRLKGQLMKLDPQTRLEQTCDAEVLLRINRDRASLNVEKVVAYTFEEPVVGENSIEAHGAAFRSGGNWYHLAYDCVTGPRHLDAHELHYEIGAKIPKADWAKYDLYE